MIEFTERVLLNPDIFNYIEFFYNPNRRHGNNNGVSPMNYEKQYFEKLSAV